MVGCGGPNIRRKASSLGSDAVPSGALRPAEVTGCGLVHVRQRTGALRRDAISSPSVLAPSSHEVSFLASRPGHGRSGAAGPCLATRGALAYTPCIPSVGVGSFAPPSTDESPGRRDFAFLHSQLWSRRASDVPDRLGFARLGRACFRRPPRCGWPPRLGTATAESHQALRAREAWSPSVSPPHLERRLREALDGPSA